MLEGSHVCFSASVIFRPWRTFSVFFRKSGDVRAETAAQRAAVGQGHRGHTTSHHIHSTNSHTPTNTQRAPARRRTGRAVQLTALRRLVQI